MRKSHRLWLCCMFAAVWVIFPFNAFGVEFKGYFKNLMTLSETSAGDDYYNDMSRLRIEMDSSITPALSAKVIYDNELFLGTFLNTPEFTAISSGTPDTYFDLEHVLANNDDVYWRHSLYRCYLSYAGDKNVITAGRQRVALGVGKIWNPEDMINPVSPLSLERDERTGADAVHADIHISTLAGIGLVYARKDETKNAVVRAKTNINEYDLSAMAGRFGKDAVLGLDFSGYIGDSGFRGEAARTFSEDRNDFIRAVLSWDYTFPNTLYILVEYLYNGSVVNNETSTSQYTGEIITRNRNFLGLGMGYDATPLVRLDAIAVVDLDENSYFLGPTVKYNIFQNLDWTMGAQLFIGDQDDEYGAMPEVYYTQAQWYF